ncbi:MAG: cytochrome c oxidase assembly protein [Chloroflexota bacterium]
MFASWHADPTVWAGVLIAGGLYAGSGWSWRREFNATRHPTAGQSVSFGLGLLVLVLALESPLDTLGDQAYFYLHMLQHLLLVLVVPVLLLVGIPGWLLRPVLTQPAVAPIFRLLTRPLVATLLFNMVFAVAHLPALFDSISANEALHAGEHLLFLATGILLWWPVLGSLDEFPQLSYPLQMGYLFLQTLPCSLVAALITLSSSPLYRQYALLRGGRMTALDDQQIGGLLMWIGGSLYFFLAMAVVFFLWAGEEEHWVTIPAFGGAAARDV